MKKFIAAVICALLIVASCTSVKEREPEELKVRAVYVYNGHRYLSFVGFYGLYPDPDDPAMTKSGVGYYGIKSQMDGYSSQVIELLNAKDEEIKALEAYNAR